MWQRADPAVSRLVGPARCPRRAGRTKTLRVSRTALNREHQALAADLYRQYAPLVLRRARRFVTACEAEEVVHEVFLKVLLHLQEFRGASSPATWLYRMTTNHCLNQLRNDKTRRNLLAQHPDSVPQPGPWGDAEARRFLDELWRHLDEEVAIVGVYYHLDGLTHDEIARILDVSAATVRNRLRALERLARAKAGSVA